MRPHGLVPRLEPFTSTIFAEMTALAVRTQAVNLGQGFPTPTVPVRCWRWPATPSRTG